MIETHAVLTCPHCGESYGLEMPADRCVVRFRCEECGEIIVPKEGDCCVFCSYADKKCPGKQGKTEGGGMPNESSAETSVAKNKEGGGMLNDSLAETSAIKNKERR